MRRPGEEWWGGRTPDSPSVTKAATPPLHYGAIAKAPHGVKRKSSVHNDTPFPQGKTEKPRQKVPARP